MYLSARRGSTIISSRMKYISIATSTNSRSNWEGGGSREGGHILHFRYLAVDTGNEDSTPQNFEGNIFSFSLYTLKQEMLLGVE
jgi:hypothetical protein